MRAGTRGKGRADGGGTIEELLQILLSTAVWVSTGSRVDREQYASDCVIHLPQNAGAVGFQFQWQPFDWGYKKHRIAELKAATEQKATAERDAEQRVLLEVEEKFRKLGEARILLDALTDQRGAEQTKLGEVTNRYNQKAALLSDLTQQQAAVSQAEAQYQQALAGFWTARADFEKTIGVE